METYQERVVEEKRQLDERLERLRAFTVGELFASLPVEEQGRLNRQQLIMEHYVNVLRERIAAFPSNESRSQT